MKSISKGLIAIAIFCWSCGSHESKEEKRDTTETKVVPSDYDLNKPEKKWELPAVLKEISGISWIDKNNLLAIEDLTPNLYLLKFDSNQVSIEKTIPFKVDKNNKFDVEDVTLVNNTAYALWSHGNIYKIKDWKTNPDVTVIKTFLNKDNNTEGMCYDPVTHNLLIACKDESDVSDEKKSTRAIYEFDLAKDSLKTEPFLLIRKDDISKMSDEKLKFFPSAIAVHPISHDIYILSTKDTKCMAVYTHDGSLKYVQLIDKDQMAQPEGICFSPDGTLYISTEGKDDASPFILQFKKLK